MRKYPSKYTGLSYVAIDWGTTSFRLWAMDGQGTVLAEVSSASGMSTLSPEQFNPFLEGELSKLSIPADVPVVACGMVGAAQGWEDAGYVDAPAKLSAVVDRAHKVKASSRNVWIIPGIAKRSSSTPDVMRGEETLLLAAVTLTNGAGVYCLPGTHSKWVKIVDGQVEDFRTFMTGELFSLVRSQTILKHTISQQGSVDVDSSEFKIAVKEAFSEPEMVVQKLFSLRSLSVLNKASDQAMLDRLSGLLIGSEISAFNSLNEGSVNGVNLISSGVLSKLYSTALDLSGITYQLMDASSLARLGLHEAAKRLFETKN